MSRSSSSISRVESRVAVALVPHISHIVLEYGFNNVHAAHDHMDSGGGGGDDKTSGRDGAERQISQRDF